MSLYYERSYFMLIFCVLRTNVFFFSWNSFNLYNLLVCFILLFNLYSLYILSSRLF